MALYVGVVNFDYLRVPGFPVERFFRDLMLDPHLGLAEDDLDDDEYWDGGGNGGNAFYEFDRAGMTKRANGWADQQNLGSTERDALLTWVNDLPYRDDFITLHLSV